MWRSRWPRTQLPHLRDAANMWRDAYLARSGAVVALGWDKRNNPQRTARATRDLKRRRNHHGPSARQLVQVDQARDAEFSGPMHRVMVGKGRFERPSLPRIRPDR